MRDLLHQIGRPRLLVVGDPILDRYIWGDAERISPEAPVIVLHETTDEVRPGGAANVASFLHGLDAEVVVAGVIGDDGEGRTLQRLLHELHVDASHVLVDPSRPTTCKQRFVGRAAGWHAHQMLRVDREVRTPLSSDLEAKLCAGILTALPDCDAVLVSDYAKGVCTPSLLRVVITAAQQRAIPVLVDPCRGVDFERYAGATLVAPNRVAAELFIGHPLHDPEAILHAADDLRRRLNLKAAVITLDRDGLACVTADERQIVSCRPRAVYDVTGAGDMVLAALGLCHAARVPLGDSLTLANAAAGLEVERFGVEPVSRAEIAAELQRGSASSPKRVSLEESIRLMASHRREGRTLVFTNGCFDLLHVGHVALLEEAAQLGDVLLVAINSDASVRKLKGTERPIIGEQDRARMLASLECVDHVLIFDDDTPHRLLHAIRPDVLVKGGTTTDIVGREVVEAYGGRVVRSSTIPGLSTTALVSRLQFRSRSQSSVLQESP